MALEGSLRDFDLFSLFNMIKTQGKTGTLVLARAQEFVKIFFEGGEIIGCDSNQVRMEDRVGAMLVRLGRLSGEELLSMIQRQRQTLKRMGTLLLESGRVTPQDLQDALFNQAMSIIYRTFRWVEGDYRFDSILPLDLDRANFPPIPVDTVLMEAARIMDEWPEVQRRLPDNSVPLQWTESAKGLSLDINQDLSGVLEGRNRVHAAGSGLNHEQETVLTYFREPDSIMNVLQISRYDELDTSKFIAEVVAMGFLEVSANADTKVASQWEFTNVNGREAAPDPGPSPWFWPAVALFLAGPILLYVPHSRASLNQGLASLQRSDVHVSTDPGAINREAWAFRMASPADGGLSLARSLGVRLEREQLSIPDYSRLPDPLGESSAPAK